MWVAICIVNYHHCHLGQVVHLNQMISAMEAGRRHQDALVLNRFRYRGSIKQYHLPSESTCLRRIVVGILEPPPVGRRVLLFGCWPVSKYENSYLHDLYVLYLNELEITLYPSRLVVFFGVVKARGIFWAQLFQYVAHRRPSRDSC